MSLDKEEKRPNIRLMAIKARWEGLFYPLCGHSA